VIFGSPSQWDANFYRLLINIEDLWSAEPNQWHFRESKNLKIYPSDLKVQDSEPHILVQFKEKSAAE
jgi:hypothetical protein